MRMYTDLADLWTLYSPPAHYEEEVETFVTLLRERGVPDGARILHLGSGGGSIDAVMKRTYRLTGVDRSERMRANAARLNPEVDYRAGDIRDVRLGETFDAVLVHDAITYMTSEAELEAVYGTAAAHLAPGGVLIALPEEIPERVRHGHTQAETFFDGEVSLTFTEVTFDPDPNDQTIEHVYIFLIREKGTLRVEVDRHICGVFTIEQWVNAVERSGFTAEVVPWNLTEWSDDDLPPMPLIVGLR